MVDSGLVMGKWPGLSGGNHLGSCFATGVVTLDLGYQQLNSLLWETYPLLK